MSLQGKRMNDHTVQVKMSEYSVVKDSKRLKTTLGSCVGIILTDGKKKISGLAHIMLPEQLKVDAAVGKYADSAIPALVKKMKAKGSREADLEAYVIGGANMFRFSSDKSIVKIGEKNVEASKRILGELEIPIILEDTGGDFGRTVIFDNATRQVSIRTLNMFVPKS